MPGVPAIGATAPVTPAAAPADAETQKAAEGFERVLLGQLAKQLESTVGGSQSGAFASLIPEAMADALSAAGGIGLSDELVRTLRTQGP